MFCGQAIRQLVKVCCADAYESTNRKCIVAEYEFDEPSLIGFGNADESEVIAIPDTAKLTRYSIVYAS